MFSGLKYIKGLIKEGEMMIRRTINIFRRLKKILTTQQCLLGGVVLLGAIVAAVLETLGVTIIVPLVNVLLQPEQLYENKWLRIIFQKINIHENNQIVIFMVCSVIAVYIMKNLYFIFYSWIKVKYACKVQRECATYMMSSYMNRGYRFFLNNNVAELIHGVNGDVVALYQVIMGLLQIFSQIWIILFIVIYMCFADIQIAFGLIVSAIFSLVLIMAIFRKKMVEEGIKSRQYAIRVGQILIQSFHGIKEVMVMRKQKNFINEFVANLEKKQNAQVRLTVGGEAPAYLIEAISICGIMSVLCIKIVSTSDVETFVATLASFAVGAFRVLPSLGKVSTAINLISGSMVGFNSVYENITEARKYNSGFSDINSKDLIKLKEESFSDAVKIENLTFSYNKELGNVLEDVNFEIPKGKSIAFVGESGAGKSTLADLILGVLVPEGGKILLDDIDIRQIPNAWSKIIGYVPQSIYLSDTTICENVAFGEKPEKIDEGRIREALKKAKILDFVEGLPEGIYTKVGDRGVRLSGGQRQRIGIARALYHEPEILILDEATSALDNDTEKSVMEAIDSLHGKMTLVIIAHRLTTIKKCDVIYEVKDRNIIKRSYDELTDNVDCGTVTEEHK